MRETSPWWFLPAPIAAGALVAALVTIFQPTLYRSETALSARRGGVPASRGELKRLARIARSDAVSAAARSSLGLAMSPDERSSVAVDARSAVLRIRYEDGDAQRGRRIAQEVALAFAQSVHERFRRGVTIDVADPVHTRAAPVSPTPRRNLALGALAGGVLGAAVAALLGRRRSSSK